LNNVFSKEAKKELKDLPEYYQRNFHFQTDGYLSKESAELYEHQTELLFRGTLHLMRRVLLGEMIKKIKAEPTKTFKLLELACGTGVATKFILENCNIY
jgi:ubiquinone/menaquinone biosynthesis C-methylase UbiE